MKRFFCSKKEGHIHWENLDERSTRVLAPFPLIILVFYMEQYLSKDGNDPFKYTYDGRFEGRDIPSDGQ